MGTTSRVDLRPTAPRHPARSMVRWSYRGVTAGQPVAASARARSDRHVVTGHREHRS